MSAVRYGERFGFLGLYIVKPQHRGKGFGIKLWRAAMEHPQPFVEWIAIDEVGRGGDALYWRGKRDPAFLAGYARVAEGGGVALYRRR